MRSALALALALTATLAPAAAAQEQRPERGITTNGFAAVTAQQDIARFSFGVAARRRTPAAAQTAASLRMRRVIAAVRAAGVAAGDLRTTSIRLFREVRRRGERRRVVRYRARQSIRVVVRDLGRAGAVVDAAVAAGATSVSGPDFDVSNRGALYRQALRVAFRDAREKAQALAEEAGVTLGRAIVIVENTRGEGLTGDDEAAAVGGGGGSERVPTPVRPGEEVIEAGVTVTFETS